LQKLHMTSTNPRKNLVDIGINTYQVKLTSNPEAWVAIKKKFAVQSTTRKESPREANCSDPREKWKAKITL
jgi:hypothetical protein